MVIWNSFADKIIITSHQDGREISTLIFMRVQNLSDKVDIFTGKASNAITRPEGCETVPAIDAIHIPY